MLIHIFLQSVFRLVLCSHFLRSINCSAVVDHLRLIGLVWSLVQLTYCLETLIDIRPYCVRRRELVELHFNIDNLYYE